MLNSIIPLLNDLGLKVGWRVLHGTPDFFSTTKKIHNALQGDKVTITRAEWKQYIAGNNHFSKFTHIEHDLVVVHDPQPLPLITHYKKEQPWIWRCHIDTTQPQKKIVKQLKPYIKQYDQIIVSDNKYTHAVDFANKKSKIIIPAINPLAQKNMSMSTQKAKKQLLQYNIKTNKPIIAQISRFDKWKDPVGVIKVFEKVRQQYNCQLVLLGSLATDDPEGQKTYEKVLRKKAASKYKKDITILLKEDHTLVNALQKIATVVVQKSAREGFGLTVTEALYKKTPVVATPVGGIPLQIIDGKTGFLAQTDNEFAERILLLLKKEKLRRKMGREGHKHVRKHFLTPRLILNWLQIIDDHLNTGGQ